jgi:hypothetical protein
MELNLSSAFTNRHETKVHIHYKALITGNLAGIYSKQFLPLKILYMKNNLHFSIICFSMSLFWLLIYMVGKQIIAVYIAGIFGLISILLISWIMLKALAIVSIQSSAGMDKLKNKSLIKKSPVKA